ncbi:MAG: hypothetical protein GEU83_12095 [Pseudonocardiaceae bacterium]|nr:hypothetical protein [Pseudonocardiaceae bacterium]
MSDDPEGATPGDAVDPYQQWLAEQAAEFAANYGGFTPQQEDRLAILLWPRHDSTGADGSASAA